MQRYLDFDSSYIPKYALVLARTRSEESVVKKVKTMPFTQSLKSELRKVG